MTQNPIIPSANCIGFARAAGDLRAAVTTRAVVVSTHMPIAGGSGWSHRTGHSPQADSQ